jgi:energy-coupling factor transport system ATP-binding protein
MIAMRGLSYTYPGAVEAALKGINLEIGGGEFVLMTGRSGSGKSTLLRCLNGLTPHFSGGVVTGSVVVAGHDVLREGPRTLSRLVGFVFQSPENQAVLDRVEAEIAFGLEQAGVERAEMRQRVEESLSLLELDELRQRPLETLSGGQRQRVAIAAALALRPRILALDEPTSQLDPQSAEEVLQALVRLNDELGLTVVLAEQRLERVVRHADRLLWLERGQIVADGPTRENVGKLAQKPPVVRLGARLGWRPLPLTVKEGRALASAALATLTARPRQAEKEGRPVGQRPVVEALKLQFSYGRTPALRGVTLRAYRGECGAVLGRNGSGKSTLLRCLVGLLRPEAGEIRLNGRPIAGRRVADVCREVAYLPQNPDDLLFADNVAQELAITLANHGLKGDGLRLSPESLLEELELSEVAGAYPRDLSTGQRQRVALAAIMVTTPAVLLLDEPTRGLDYQAKEELVRLWRKWKAAGMGLVLVSHDVELVAQIADRVVILSKGEVVVEGPTAEVLADSPLFAPQMARLFPGMGWLTVEDALHGLGEQRQAGGRNA